MLMTSQTMRTLRMHGRLGDLYGREHKICVDSPAQAIRWCCTQLRENKKTGTPSFESVFAQGAYKIVRGGRAIDDVEEINLKLGAICDLSIVPVIAGEKNGGLGKAIFGALLIAAAVVFAPASAPAVAGIAGPLGSGAAAGLGATIGATGITYGSVVLLGSGVALAGIQRMLTPTPHVANNQSRERPDARGNFLLNSITNQSAEGGCVPYAAGLRVRIGTIVGSAGIRIAYTPLDELIDEQTEFDSYYNIYAPLTSLVSDDVDFVGVSRIRIADEDETADFGPHGASDPASFRSRFIAMIGETRDRTTSERAFQVVIMGNNDTDFFQLIRVTSLDEQTEYIAKATSNVDDFTQELVTLYLRSATAEGGWAFQRVQATRWTWDLGTGPASEIPPAGVGEAYRVKFSY